MNPDLINALFELGGAFAIAISVRKLYNDKLVRGISWLHVGFFMLWGAWNLYFYPSVNAPLSFYAGAVLCAVNTVYTLQLIYYTLKEKHGHREKNTKEPDYGSAV